MKRTDALKLAKQLFREHGLDKKGWKFAFDRAVLRHGVCNEFTKSISISGPLVALNDEAWVRELLLHEIAHALAGNEAGHGPRWQAICRRIGAIPQALGDKPPFTPTPKYLLTCEGCGASYPRQKIYPDMYCGECGPEVGKLLVTVVDAPKKSRTAPSRPPRVA
jgi:predicted SprT family Zn-dependent metalloprotease